MAPTKTAAKGRARAGRASDAAAAPAVESPPPAAATNETPRRRGRPAKSESGTSSAKVKKTAYVPTGRPRGRPANPDTKPKAPYVPTGRPRGRPPGSGKKSKAAAQGRAAVARAGKKGTSVARGGPKGRKSDAAKAKEDEELGEDVDMEGSEEAGDDEQLSDEDGGE